MNFFITITLKKDNFIKLVLFAVLFCMIELAAALSFSVAESRFVADIGLEGLPLAYILLFVVMSISMLIVAYLQSKFSLEKVILILFSAFLLFVGTLSFIFTFVELEGSFANTLLYALKLGANIWMYASFSLYWNLADEYFTIIDGKKNYSIFSAFGCFGAVIGSGIVLLFSQYLKVDALMLMWVWFFVILLSLPLLYFINKKFKKLESGISLEADINISALFKDKIFTMYKSNYVRGLFALYLFVIFAAILNEYSAMSAFSDYATSLANNACPEDLEKAKEISQFELASIFGGLGIGVNVFNFVINLFVFNKLVSRVGVSNLVFVQPVLYFVSFLWLINSFGMPAAIFSFFMYRGVMESIDANNSNLMISVLPSSIRQQVRLLLESFVVPFATALAGVFLMLFSQNTQELDLENPLAIYFVEVLGFANLSIIDIAMFGLLISIFAVISAGFLKSGYPKVLARNLKRGSLDFSKRLSEILTVDIAKDYRKLCKSNDEVLSLASIEKINRPLVALDILFKNFQTLSDENRLKVKEIIEYVVENHKRESVRYIIKWLIDESVEHSDFIIEILSKMNISETSFALESLSFKDNIDNSYKYHKNIDSSETSKLDSYNIKEQGVGELFNLIDSSNEQIRNKALTIIAENANESMINYADILLSRYKNSSYEDSILILKALSKIHIQDNIEALLKGVVGSSTRLRSAFYEFLIKCDVIAVPSLIHILRSQDYSFKAKSLCAKALLEIFPAQLYVIADEIFDIFIEFAYQFSAAEESLEGYGENARSLQNIYNWKKKDCVCFIILIFSLTGRLPAYETLENAIFSEVGKELANAIETFENALSKDDFNLILPLIDKRSLSEQVKFGKKHFNIKDVSDTKILQKSITSVFDTDFLAGASILLSRKSESLTKFLCLKIGSLKTSRLRTMLLELFDDLFVFKDEINVSILHKFSALSLCSYFKNFEPSAIFELSQSGEFSEKPQHFCNRKSIFIFSKSNFLNDATHKIYPANTIVNLPPEGAIIYEIDTIYKVISNYPNAAISVYLMQGGAL